MSTPSESQMKIIWGHDCQHVGQKHFLNPFVGPFALDLSVSNRTTLVGLTKAFPRIRAPLRATFG